MTTRSQADALRRQLVTLTRRGQRTLSNLFDTYNQAQLAEAVPHVVLPIIDLAAVSTAAWYADLDDASSFVPVDDSRVQEGRVNYTLSWAFNQTGESSPADRFIGAFQRMVFDGSRNVVVASAKLEGVPWHRDALPDACSFCRLLTVDPQAYDGKYVEMPSHNHDCRCLAVV
ncbi:MAG TPA: hypothetical protein VJ777_07130, partial [Mycobacterium sp.]|nr:hypothetical protein [Mycobacterium sp.]